MPKHQYNISLKGYVGGYDFDRNTVDSVLAKNDGKEVNVLIDSLGGSLATGLSISAAFKNHGNVTVMCSAVADTARPTSESFRKERLFLRVLIKVPESFLLGENHRYSW